MSRDGFDGGEIMNDISGKKTCELSFGVFEIIGVQYIKFSWGWYSMGTYKFDQWVTVSYTLLL